MSDSDNSNTNVTKSSSTNQPRNFWQKRGNYSSLFLQFSIVFCDVAGVKRKQPEKCKGNIKDVLLALEELDKRAEERYKLMEEKRIKFFMDAEEVRRKAYAEEEEKHRQEERKHEERMQRLFFTFMQQMSSGQQGMPSFDSFSRSQFSMYSSPSFPGTPEHSQ